MEFCCSWSIIYCGQIFEYLVGIGHIWLKIFEYGSYSGRHNLSLHMLLSVVDPTHDLQSEGHATSLTDIPSYVYVSTRPLLSLPLVQTSLMDNPILYLMTNFPTWQRCPSGWSCRCTWPPGSRRPWPRSLPWLGRRPGATAGSPWRSPCTRPRPRPCRWPGTCGRI